MPLKQLIPGLLLTSLLLACPAAPALAWGYDGHRTVARITEQLLQPQVRETVTALLASDPSHLTKHDIASESTWADAYKYAKSSNDPHAPKRGRKWHYINLQIKNPDMDKACYGFPALSAGTVASQGTSRDCIVNKIAQFAHELAQADTPKYEKRLALKFLIHLVGDLHQPLHAADNHDRGGNSVHVSGITHRSATLHHAWDTVFVRKLGKKLPQLAQSLLAHITPEQLKAWQQGNARDWAWESFRIAKSEVYGRLPHQDYRHLQHLDAAYVSNAKAVVEQQLSKAGVRLAWLLNRTLSHQQAGTLAWPPSPQAMLQAYHLPDWVPDWAKPMALALKQLLMADPEQLANR